jgi:hypothetical protein
MEAGGDSGARPGGVTRRFPREQSRRRDGSIEGAHATEELDMLEIMQVLSNPDQFVVTVREGEIYLELSE